MATFNHTAEFTVQLLQKPLGELIEMHNVYGINGDFNLHISGATEKQFDDVVFLLRKQFKSVGYCFELIEKLNVKILMG